MPTIVWLALAAAVYPQLLAIVVVILTRPDPRRLLLACYLAAFWMSVACSVLILLVFRDRGGVAGSTSHRVGASVFLSVGVIAVLIAILMLTEGGRRLLSRVSGERLPHRRRPRGSGLVERQMAHAHGALARGSVPIGVAVGTALGILGPFDMLALGRLARGGYAVLAAVLTIIAFSVVKFVLIEIPIASYMLNPDGTAARVGRFSTWMRAHHMTFVAVVVDVVGVVLIAQGVSRVG